MSLSMGHPRRGTAVPEADIRQDSSEFLMYPDRRAVCSKHNDSGCELEQSEFCSVHGPVKELLHLQDEGPAAGLKRFLRERESTTHKQGDTTCERAVSEDVESGICSSDGRVREPLDPQGTSATGHGHRSILRRLPGEWFSCHPVLHLVLILLLLLLLASVVALAMKCCAAPQAPVPTAPPPLVLGCSPDWHEYKGVCYNFSKDHRSWDEAQERCSELGASLAIVTDEAMDLLSCLGVKGDYWIGLRRRGEHLQWGDGSSFSSRFEVLGNSECVYMADNKFRSFSCSNPQPYLCSKARAPL